MPLRGTGFLAIWHDIKSEAEAEYSEWHTREHIPERVGVPGFIAGRRYVDWKLDKHRWFTIYEGTTPEVFGSEAYRAKLNAPSEWSIRMQPNFLNFVRSACETISTSGIGLGGALATFRLALPGDGRKAIEGAAKSAERIGQMPGVVGVHVGWAAPAVSRVKTRETELRKLTGEDVFDAVVVVDGVGRRELEPLMPAINDLLRGALAPAANDAAVYDFAYGLESDE